MIIEGYFALYNKEAELWPGAYEIIERGAFDNTLENDIKALINHESRLVLGRNKNGTLSLRSDAKGLWGRIQINPKDTEAVNLYERVKRGDIDQCSFGFNIREEDSEYLGDGSVRWTLKDIDLREVSCVTFPAYGETCIQARRKDAEKIKMKRMEETKKQLKERLRNGA